MTECFITVVNRGPKGWACTGTHKGHTGRDSCSKMCKFTLITDTKLYHSLLSAICSFDRIVSMGRKEDFTAYF